MSEKIIWTIGHSTRTLEELVKMLHSFNIELVADIRSFPASRRFPHFNKESLIKTFLENEIEYTHLVNLGGRRKTLPDSHNAAWRLNAFRGYADYMETTEFKQAIKELKKNSLQKKTAYMCSEAVWWRCHRSLVSDYLKLHGWTVLHIMAVNKTKEHPYISPAKIIDGKLSYEKED